jgi:type II secretory pathway component PulC
MTKLLILFFGVAIMNLRADSTNIYEEIVERNAFDLTEEKITKILPPITDILRAEVFLTGIHSISNVKRVSLVVREKGSDKFVSLTNLQASSGIQIKSIGSTNVLASVYGTHKLLSFEKHGLPTTITKAPPKLMQRSDKDKRVLDYINKMRDEKKKGK